MHSNRTRWHWFSTSLGVNTTIVLFNAILIGLLWYAVFERVRVEREDTIRAAINRNDNLAIAFEQYTIRTIESADAVIRYLIREFARSGGKMDVARFVADYTVDNKAIAAVVLADERGDAITTAYASKPLNWTNVADREHFRVHIERDSGKVFVGKPVVGRISGKILIPITRRISKADGTFGGVAMALIEPARFTDVLHDARLRQLDVISLVGLDGVTRARLRGATPSSGEDVSNARLFTEQATRPTGNYFGPGQLDGVPKFFSYRTLPEYQVMTVIGTAEADVMAELYRRRSGQIWAAGLTSAVIAGFAILLMLALTRQRRMEAARQESETRFRTIFEQAGIGIAIADIEDRRILRCNPALAEMLGYSVDELRGMSIERVSHPDDYLKEGNLRQQMVDGLAKRFRMEKRFRRKDGELMWGILTATIVRAEDATPQFVIGMLEDITERKKSEVEVHRLANRLTATMESITDGFFTLDRDWRFTYVNSEAERLVQRTNADLLGKVIWEEFTDAADSSAAREFRQAMRTMRTAEFAAHYASMGLWFEARAYPSEEGLAVYFRDITERKKSQQRLQTLSEKMLHVQESERASLARELHDEFGQVLTAVKLQLQLLEKRTPSPRLEDCIALVDQALRQVRSLSLDLRPFQLDDLGLGAALGAHLERLSRQSALSISFECDPGVPRLIGPRATAFFRIAQEAVTNAMRHAQARSVQVKLYCEGELLVLVVSDDGVGFDIGKMRADAVKGGSLGMMSMEERVRMFGGTLDIRPAGASGTVVVARIPLGFGNGNDA